MGVVPPDEFARRLRALDAPARARFVAAVCEARGRETDVEGRRVRVAAGTARAARVLWIAPDRRRRRPPADVDVVVAVAVGRRDRFDPEGRDVEVLDARGLRDRLLYGLDRETAGRLCRRHLGCDVDGWSVDDGGDGTTGGAAVVALALVLGLSLVLVLVLVGAGLDLAGAGPLATVGGERAADGTPGATGATGTTAASTVPPAAATGDRRSEVGRGADALGPLPIEWSTDDGYPPGVTPGGVTNARTLARAHGDVLRPPYTWRVTYREVRNGTVRGELTATVRVADERTFVSSVETNGSLEATPPAGVPVRERYANGGREYVLRDTGAGGGGAALARRGPPGSGAERYVDEAGLLVRRTLGGDGTETAVAAPVDDGDVGLLYRVRATGSEAPDARNATGRAIVTEFGLVEALYHEYTPAGHPDVRAVVTFEYRVGAVAVERPSWLVESDERTPERGTATGNRTATATPA
jgi:hypothetical protein